MGYRVGRVSSRAVSSWSRSPGCCGFRGVFWVGRFFFPFERTRPAASMRPPCLVYLSTNTVIARAVRGRFPRTRDLWRKWSSVGERVGRVSSHAVSRWSRSPDWCGFRVVQLCFGWADFFVFFSPGFFFFSNFHGLLQVGGRLVLFTSLHVIQTASSMLCILWYEYTS